MLPSCNSLPYNPVVVFSVAAVERGVIGDGAFGGAGGESVVGDGACDGAGLHVFDFLPLRSGVADTWKTLTGCEDNAAFLVVPGVGFVLTHDGELDAVDGYQFIQRKAESLCYQHIDFDQGLPTSVVGAEGAITGPFRGKVMEEGVREAWVVLHPCLFSEGILPAGCP